MNDLSTWQIVGIIIAILLSLICIFIVGMKAEQDSWREETIKKGFAKYNEKTGVWELIK